MASYSDQQLLAAVQRQLQPGENVVSVAFGHKPMNVGLQILMTLGFLGGLLPGVVFAIIFYLVAPPKNYVVALTNMRLIVNQVDGSLGMKSTMDFPVPVQGRITGQPKGNFIDFAIFGQRSVEMKFFRNNGPTNYNNAQMIVQALQQGQMGGPMGAGQPGAGYGQPQMGGGAPGGQLPPGGGYGPPGGGAPGGGYGPPQGGGAPPGGGGYGPPGAPPGGGAPGGGYGPPGGGAPGGGYGPPQGGGGAPPGGGGYGPPGAPPGGGGYGPPGGGGGYGPQGGGYGPS